MINSLPVAVIDIGSNSFHMIIARLNPEGELEIAARERVKMRLVKFTATERTEIRPESFVQSVAIIQQMEKIARGYSCQAILITATSAVRDSVNGSAFLTTIAQETGLQPRLLSGVEEASMVQKAVTYLYPQINSPLLIADIGGGSTELISVNAKSEISMESFPVGHVRFCDLYQPDYRVSRQSMQAIRSAALSAFQQVDWLNNTSRGGVLIGTSGIFRTLFEIASGSINQSEGLDRPYLADLMNTLFTMPEAEMRQSYYQLDPGRTDILPAGLQILNVLLDVSGCDSIRYSAFSVREGIALEYFQQ